MKGFEDIQQLWQRGQNEPVVDYHALLRGMKSSENKLVNKLMWQVVGQTTVAVLLLYVIFGIQFSTWTTYLGVLIMFFGVLYTMFVSYRNYRSLHKNGKLFAKPQAYITYLQEYQQRQNRFNTRDYGIYEWCIGAALALFSLEMYFLFSLWVFAGCLILLFGWILFCHFVLMKNYLRIENQRIQQMIDDLERIKNQFVE